MKKSRLSKLGFLLFLSLVMVGLTIQFGMAGKEEVEEEAVVEKAAPVTGSSADIAVEEAKKYSGITLSALWEGGLQAQDPLTMGPLWEKLTGIKINVVQMGFLDMYASAIQDHLTGVGSYDVITYTPHWLIDFANAGVMEPLNPYIDKYMNKADLEDYLPPFAADGYGRLGDTWYGFPDDGDIFILYYRKDLFEDPENKAAFKAKYGYELAAPKTWTEFDEIGKFFTDKYAPKLYGGAIQRLEGLNYYWWMGAFSGNGGQFFNTDTMEPMINSEVGVLTLKQMVDQNKWMPPGIRKWGFMEVLSAWLEGKLAMTITWPPYGRWSAGYGAASKHLSWVPTSQVIGKVGYAPMPGGRQLLAGGYCIGVSSDSKHKEAAYLFAQWMNSPEISMQRVTFPFALRDPFRISHFESPLYRSLWDNSDEYLDTLREAGMLGQNLLGIPGAREYDEALDNACTAAYAGTDPKVALDDAAKRWKEITKRLGIKDQKEAYSIWRRGPWNKEGPKTQ